jgi:hypothetical protein
MAHFSVNCDHRKKIIAESYEYTVSQKLLKVVEIK